MYAIYNGLEEESLSSEDRESLLFRLADLIVTENYEQGQRYSGIIFRHWAKEG